MFFLDPFEIHLALVVFKLLFFDLNLIQFEEINQRQGKFLNQFETNEQTQSRLTVDWDCKKDKPIRRLKLRAKYA